MSEPNAWIALHIHYAANPQPLLVHCVRQVFAELTGRGLVDGYFYINYWLEGPHVRLRFRPRDAGAVVPATRLAEQRIGEYLRRRPALYDVDAGFLGELYQQLFAMELSEEEQARHLTPAGQMILRPNNEVVRAPYVPEYGKYGGRAGVALAEWHFRHSSDLTLAALHDHNLHLRPVLLGTAAQLMMVLATVFLPDPADVASFLRRYHDFWESHFAGTDFIAGDRYRQGLADNGAALARQVGPILQATQTGSTDRLPPLLAAWADHCHELRSRVVAQAHRAPFTFESREGGPQQVTADPAAALVMLLSPFLHMTNNRLHVTIRDEAYLAFLLSEALLGRDR